MKNHSLAMIFHGNCADLEREGVVQTVFALSEIISVN